MATTPDGLEPIATTGPDRRVNPAQLVLVVVGLLLVLFLLWFFVLRSDDEPEDAAVAPAPVTEEAAPEEDAAEAPTKKSPVETFEVFAPKDPFDPLISASSGGAGDSSATSLGTGTAVGTTTATGTGTATATSTSTAPSGGSDGGEDIGGHRVRVVDVFTADGGTRAQIQVDGTVYTVDEGERFADNFQLLSASGRCATMLFGDDEFTLCEGEEILK